MAAKKSNTQTNTINPMNLFQTIAQQNMERMNSAFQTWADLEKKASAQLNDNTKELMAMGEATVNYYADLNQQFREMTLTSFENFANVDK